MRTNSERARMRQKLRDSTLRECAQLAGQHFDLMLRSYEDSQKYVNHSDARVRLAALEMVHFYWGSPPGFRRICERLVLEEDDLKVREMALLSLGVCYGGTYDFRIGKLLVDVVRDENQPLQCRSAAYQALFYVRGLVMPDYLAYRFPDGVDWNFVDSFSAQREPPSEAEQLQQLAPSLDEETCRAVVSWKKSEKA